MHLFTDLEIFPHSLEYLQGYYNKKTINFYDMSLRERQNYHMKNII